MIHIRIRLTWTVLPSSFSHLMIFKVRKGMKVTLSHARWCITVVLHLSQLHDLCDSLNLHAIAIKGFQMTHIRLMWTVLPSSFSHLIIFKVRKGMKFKSPKMMHYKLCVVLCMADPVHVALTCVRSGEGSDHFGSYVHSLSLHFCKRLFLGLEPMTSWSQGNRFTTAPGLPICVVLCIKKLPPFHSEIVVAG
jgi:hypothetical protein